MTHAIRIHQTGPDALARAEVILGVLQDLGVPNRFGDQRYGVLGNSHRIGRAILSSRTTDGVDFLRLARQLPEWEAEPFTARPVAVVADPAQRVLGVGALAPDSPVLVQMLAAEGVNLPPTVVQKGIDSYVLHTDTGTVTIQLDERALATPFDTLPGPADRGGSRARPRRFRAGSSGRRAALHCRVCASPPSFRPSPSRRTARSAPAKP